MNTVLQEWELIIFTTFDSSLFDREDESYHIVVSTIKKLQNHKIPVVTVTNKTYAEIADLQKALNLKDPVIVEYGSGVLSPEVSRQFLFTESSEENNYPIKQLGCTYVEARAALKVIQSIVRINNLRGFGDLSETEIQSLTGLSKKQVKQVKTREFSEIFVTPKSVDSQEIISTAEEFGFKALIGDSLSCLIGAEASVKKAIQCLKDSYQLSESANKVVTVGLGNSNRDLEMLEAVDIPVLIASKKEIDFNLVNREWRTIQANGLSGWVQAINHICEEYLH